MNRLVLKVASLAASVIMLFNLGACQIDENAADRLNGGLGVHFIDVGQGDSSFVSLPDGTTMLIDAGDKAGGETVTKYLKNQHIERIDILVATHPHSDHIGGMTAIVKNFEIGEIYMPKIGHTSKTFENLLLAIKEKGCKINSAAAGVNIYTGEGVSVEILSPVKEAYSNLNNYSAVIKLSYKDTSFLFLGDAENEALELIEGDVSASVLKVAHHGSDTSDSDAFLSRVNPRYAVISVGKGNSYGHPKAKVLSLIQNNGAKIYRTDICGTIVFESNGEEIYVKGEK